MGVTLSTLHPIDLLLKGIYAGMFVGFGGILSMSVGFDMGGSPWLPGKGIQRFICGAFGLPFSNMLMAFTGAAAFTGDLLSSLLAYKYSLIDTRALIRINTVSYIGCYLGNALMGLLCSSAALYAIGPCINASRARYACPLTQTFFKAIFGSMLVCSGIFGTKTTDSFVGKAFTVWAAVTTQVACNFEHAMSSMFVLTVGALQAPRGSFLLREYLIFLATATAGNAVGIALMSLGVLGSYAFDTSEKEVLN